MASSEAWVHGHVDCSDEWIKEQLEKLGAALSAGDVDRLLRLAAELRDQQGTVLEASEAGA